MALPIASMTRRRALAALGLMPLLAARGAFASDTFATLVPFDGTNGSGPNSPLVPDGAGGYYGITASGGAFGTGTLFTVSSSGAFVTLHDFDGEASTIPSGLAIDGSGQLYVTVFGGLKGSGASVTGSILRFSTTGLVKTLQVFRSSGDAAYPIGPVTLDSRGNLYGTAMGFGGSATAASYQLPSIFRITPAGVLSTLQSFTFASIPNPGLAIDSDGNLYGTTNGGGAARLGTIFQITPRGAFSTLYEFDGSEGKYPSGPLTLTAEGELVGTTGSGGSGGSGTVYKISTAGRLKTLYAFTEADPGFPSGPLALDSAGNLYGTTELGGIGGAGTVFELTPARALNVLYGFSGPDGSNPTAGVTVDGQGNVFGTTATGGPDDDGTIFKLSAS